MTGQLDGKIAIVTGASAGIGRGIVLAFANEGASLMLAARDRVNLELAVREITALGGNAVAMPTDVTDDTQGFA